MFRSRPTLRRLGLLGVALALLSGLFVIPAIAANSSVTGTLTYRGDGRPLAAGRRDRHDRRHDRRRRTPGRHRPATDRRADQLPDRLLRLVDPTTIDPDPLLCPLRNDHRRQRHLAEPGRRAGHHRRADQGHRPRPAAVPQPTRRGPSVARSVPPADTTLSPQAVSIAALIKVETGTLVARQSCRSRPTTQAAGPTSLSFAIGYDPSLIDPAATYVVKGGVVDGANVWQNRDGVTAISGGPRRRRHLPVTAAPDGRPGPVERRQSRRPSASAAPSAAPTAAPSAAPTATSRPPAPRQRRPPTPAPTATPARRRPPHRRPPRPPPPAPTPTPGTDRHTRADAEPNAGSDADPDPDTHADRRCPRALRRPAPITGPVTGTLTYKEPHQLSGDAFAVVALVSGSARVTESSIVASRDLPRLTPVPFSFSLDLGSATSIRTPTYTIQATIVDGENAWATAHGVPVLTKGNPRTSHHARLPARPAEGRRHRPDHRLGLEPIADGLLDGDPGRSDDRRDARHRRPERRRRPPGRLLGAVRDHRHPADPGLRRHRRGRRRRPAVAQRRGRPGHHQRQPEDGHPGRRDARSPWHRRAARPSATAESGARAPHRLRIGDGRTTATCSGSSS